MSRPLENIDKIVEEAVTQRTHAAIVQSLEGDMHGLVSKIVDTVLHTKVRDGNTYRDIPFIQMVARDAIQEVAKEAVAEWAQKARPKIQAELERQLSTSKTHRLIATQLVDKLVKTAESTLRYNFVLRVVDEGEDS
jgi:histidine ammonia-lyase